MSKKVFWCLLFFVLVALASFCGIGAVLDYRGAESNKVALQSALDSTALMLSKEAETDTSKQLQTSAERYFGALFTRPEAKNIRVTAAYTRIGGAALVVTSSADVPTLFLRFVGYDNITVAGSSTAKWGSNLLRVALVLDNAGSMANDGKISALASATKGFLSQLRAAATNSGDVYVSVIPFAKDVNIGHGNLRSSWIDWSDWDSKNGVCSNTAYGNNRSNCEYHKFVWTVASHNTWNGCVSDHGISATQFRADQDSACPLATMALNYDWAGMVSVINKMSAAGSGNQITGLEMGLMSLFGGGPFTVPAKQPGTNYSQIIILITDGLNAPEVLNGNRQIDGELVCRNIKAAGGILYTIQVNTRGGPTSTSLKNCASTPDKFYLLTSASQINSAFKEIGRNLTQLRVAR